MDTEELNDILFELFSITEEKEKQGEITVSERETIEQNINEIEEIFFEG